MKPVLFVTGHAPAYRVGALARLHELEGIELALFGGSLRHGGGGTPVELPVPHVRVRPREIFALADGERYRAVVCSTGGRLAPLASWAGARRARLPLILWASLWGHPRSAVHAFTYLPLRTLYRSADAVVTYGPHVSAYVRARGARNVHVAPQSVDNDFWRAQPGTPVDAARWTASSAVRFLFVGRPEEEKGLSVLLSAWRAAALPAQQAALVLAGVEARSPALARHAGERSEGAPVVALGRLTAEQLRGVYGACDVLVVPSLRTRTFLEPWGLVVNEAMNQGLAVIASNAVGAAAGGLVRDGENGLVVPAGSVEALAGALARLASQPALKQRMGASGAHDVLAFDHDAWARGFSAALASLGVSRARW